MKSRTWEGHRGQSYLWLSYAVAVLTSIFFATVFGAFIFRGFMTILVRGENQYLPLLLWETLQTLGLAFMISAPMAGLLTLRLQEGRSQGRPGLFLILRESLRCPSLVFGIVLIFFAKTIAIENLLMVVLVGLLVPRLAYGWFRILEGDSAHLREVGGAMGLGAWQIFRHLVLPLRWSQLVEYSVKVVVILAGAVAPLVYLTSLSHGEPGDGGYFTLEAFASLVKGQDQTPEVWMLLSLLAILIFVLSTGESMEKKSLLGRRGLG